MMVSTPVLTYVSSPNRTLRLCNEDCVIKGVTIKKGVQVLIPMDDIHKDPEIWPEPDKFIPERCACVFSCKPSCFSFMGSILCTFTRVLYCVFDLHVFTHLN